MKNIKIAVVGLGYVGLPLARLFATKYAVVGFDVKVERIHQLMNGEDNTLEISEEVLKGVLRTAPLGENETGLFCTHQINDMRDCNIYIITVPTPVDKHNHPDLIPLIKASETVGKVITSGNIVIYESTVYPGATEEDCVPVIERTSGLIFNKDFFAGYSPERINPGDKEHTVERIKKITSGSTPEIGEKVNALYHSVITAGTYLASSIKVAEAAKVIENSQRDINIAFVNELSKIFGLMGIDTSDVLAAAATKWNFLSFKPGLVGGHCIGVDPYYLAQKAQEYGYHPEVILAGRRMNDGMGEYIAKQALKCMIKKGQCIKDSRVLIMGITFKENCPDIRNTKVVDIIRSLKDFELMVDIYDPWASPQEVKREYGLDIMTTFPTIQYDAVILTVAHNEFRSLHLRDFCKSTGILYDVKNATQEMVDGKL